MKTSRENLPVCTQPPSDTTLPLPHQEVVSIRGPLESGLGHDLLLANRI